MESLIELNQTPCQDWAAPTLVCYGRVQDLTAGGSIGSGECDGASPAPGCATNGIPNPNFPGQPGNAGHPFYTRF